MKVKYSVKGLHSACVRVNVRDVKRGAKFLWRGDLCIKGEDVPYGSDAIYAGNTYFIGHNAKVECFFSDLNWI